MIMAVNVGNSRISIGFFENTSCCVKYSLSLSADVNKTADEYYAAVRSIVRENGCDINELCGGIVASVVPQLTGTVCATVKRFVGKEPILVGAGVKTGFAIRIDSPSELGGDMVANASAVCADKKDKAFGGAVIVDMGAVTTVSAVNKNREFVGCSILSGVGMSLEALHMKTALLPNVSCASGYKTIGRNTQESVLSGVMIGNAIMLDGFVRRYAAELRVAADELRCVIRGEYAKYIFPLCKQSFEYDAELTLKGLFRIYEKTSENKVDNNRQ